MLDRNRSRNRSRTGDPFSPAGLFVSGAQGAWYDPSDFSTLFQNSTGTTPVTAVEQPVRLMLDRSRGGVGTNGALCRNLLTRTEEFDNAAWIKSNVGVAAVPTVTANAGTAPDGTATADRVQYSLSGGTASGDISNLYQTNATTGVMTHSVYLKSFDGVSSYVMQIVDSTGVGQPITVTGAWQRFSVSATSAGSINYAIRLRGGQSPTNSSTADVLIWGAQLELGSTATAYQPITASWAATMPGNHAVAPNDASRPVLRARYNQLTFSEQFDNGWTLQNVTVGANAIAAPDGTTTADKIAEDSATSGHALYRNVTIAGSVANTFSVFAKAAERSIIWLAAYDGDSATARVAWFNLGTGAVGTVQAGATATIQALADGWYRCTVVRTNSSALTAGIIQVGVTTTDNVSSYAGSTGSGAYIWGAQLLTAADQTATGGAYQRIAAATDYDTSNPVFRPYLAFDGSDDYMVLGSAISITTNMTVVRGFGRSAAGIISVGVGEPSDAAYDALWANDNKTYLKLGGTTLNVSNGSTATGSFVISSVRNAASQFFRRNGSQISSVSAPAVSGTLTEFGRRGSTYNNGPIYGIIVLDRELTGSELTVTEQWMAGKTGAY